MEIWKSIVGYEGLYEVSDQGRVRSLNWDKTKQIRVLRTRKNDRGYIYVLFSKDGHSKAFLVHRLVAQAFIPNPLNLPQVNHRDVNPSNNFVGNLEWCDSQYNTDYSVSKPVQQIDMTSGEVIATYKSAMEAHRRTGINHGNLCEVCAGHRKSAGGYGWRYM